MSYIIYKIQITKYSEYIAIFKKNKDTFKENKLTKITL